MENGVGAGGLVVPDSDTAPLFEPVEAAFDDVAPPVEARVEGRQAASASSTAPSRPAFWSRARGWYAGCCLCVGRKVDSAGAMPLPARTGVGPNSGSSKT